MTIKIVVKYAKRQLSSDRETYRRAALTVKLQKDDNHWHWAAGRANADRKPGERVVSISEAGYH